ADLTTLGPKSLLLAPAADLEAMRQALRDYLPFIRDFTQATNLESLFAQVNKQFRMAPAEATASTEALVKAVPFLQRLVVQAQQSLLRPGLPPSPGVGALFGAGPEANQQIYVTLDQGRLYLLTVRPRSEQVIAQAIERLRQLVEQTQVEVPGVDVGLTGAPVLDFDELRQSEHDSLVASIAALIICSLIFIIAYRQLGRPLKAALCLLIGLAYTMGFTTLTIGHLNILTITFAPMLIGLAIDFGIHLITRYEEEMRNRRTIEEALFKAMVFTGQGIITGGFTTAAAFLAMALTNFKGIREMGIISGGGLLLCLIPMMTTLPALLLRGPQNARDHELGPVGRRRVRIENVWLQRPVWVVLVTLVLCAGAVWGGRRVHFDYNLLHMQSQSLASVTYEKKLLHSGARSVIFAAVVADSAPQAREYERRIQQLPAVARVESVAGFFTQDQSQQLELVRAIQREVSGIRFAPIDPNPPDLQTLSTTLWILMGYAGLAADDAQKDDPDLAGQLRSLRSAITNFRRTLLSGKPNLPGQLYAFRQALFGDLHRTFDQLQHQDTSGPLRPQDLPASLRDRFIGVTGKYLLQVYPRKDIWNHDNQREFIGQLQSVVPPDSVTGDPVQFYAY
ncbi:MAG TPA: MMPL family transporter, partial [Candidatus Sulfotelmatobacter sp.]|nr:MMPL family transporter [Candidatus Sulfotelmatobacter sp.]